MTEFQEKLKLKMHQYAKMVYKATKNFPANELYGITSQLRRSAMSVILNYTEGFARRKPAVILNFYEISYGSLKESKYLIYFSYTEDYLSKEDYQITLNLSEEIGKMLWNEIQKLDK